MYKCILGEHKILILKDLIIIPTLKCKVKKNVIMNINLKKNNYFNGIIYVYFLFFFLQWNAFS